jgi:hypothetical protein
MKKMQEKMAVSRLPIKYQCRTNLGGLCDGTPLGVQDYLTFLDDEEVEIIEGVGNLSYFKKIMAFAHKITGIGVLIQLRCLFEAVWVYTELDFNDLWQQFSHHNTFQHKYEVVLFSARMSKQYFNNIKLIAHDQTELLNHINGTSWWSYNHISKFCKFQVNSIQELKHAICSSSTLAIDGTDGRAKVKKFVKALRSTGIPLACNKNGTTLMCTTFIDKVAKY